MKRRKSRFVWRLEEVMHARGLHSIAGLQRELTARGVELSSSQAHRLVTQTPERLNLEVLAAVCEILHCSPADLIELPVSLKGGTRCRGCGQVSRPFD